ncbi:MAG TPA: CoB--CoM heterodisulfide reductase iron-sulfur subunit B family protein [Polyangiaceae bacterium]|jgi:heterodisulfide reductase subunit B|nr:MAG: succinate dehydrogenase/fumarate reductase iron-sulfur subunit [Deltaproteobacteria bacterium ADurb.Bin207]HNS97922.1 CoB--CoM heterodisulfide reductase iron-sulfur subunit B family protein [Polyangiaceae bacterium]HNZ21737.1 CoB--CoM heterodisulfide reductase iron-sulfur subunit B family protein [Polyangiaceae bacterium]HOD21596.1 CoB--CoM heterodisulfide reductase iron-sulfur subunit B family protein [Polyangiaceae bacterium]HOE50568.1 CoB--CoM heterodisulfide reductase iron-sulfur su
MKVSYYPGCTLKTKARNLEDTAIGALAVLGVELVELPRWNCCGAVTSLAQDDLLHMLAPVRDLIRAKEQGSDKLVTICSMCYNTLARANLLMRNDAEKRDALNRFMDEEPDYAGEVEVIHLLNFIRDEVGWDKLRAAVRRPLTGLRVAPYYGCTLVRPAEVAIEPAVDATVFEKFIEALGAQLVHNPGAFDCCGSYQILSHPKQALAASAELLGKAKNKGADVLALSCPLCDYNLGKRQNELVADHGLESKLPTIYFTQLLAVALGLDSSLCHFELNHEGTRSLLEERNLISTVAV